MSGSTNPPINSQIRADNNPSKDKINHKKSVSRGSTAHYA